MKNKTVLTFCLILTLIFVSLTFFSCDLLNDILGGEPGNDFFTPNTEQMVAALKEALTKGAEKAGSDLSITGAFYNNMARRIPLPPEAQGIRDKLSNNALSQAIGGDKMFEDLIHRINSAAEESSKEVGAIFGTAITSMTFSDAAAILKGSDTEATDYLTDKTTDSLKLAFGPNLNDALNKSIFGDISAQSTWDRIVNPYNAIVNSNANLLLHWDPVDTSLGDFVLDKALTSVFNEMAEEEKKIRANPMQFLSDAATKVFNWAKDLIL